MGFNTALSGIRAASQDLAVTGNNIANASTVGFKESRAEFADVYASSILGTGSRTAGSGVLVANIAQQFDQGNISITNNSLDLAIDGGGFFILNQQGAPVYTRSGIFGLDNQGFVVGNGGGRLQGFSANASGQIISGALGDLHIETQDIAPRATTQMALQFNLDSREEVPPVGTFNMNDPNSYNWSTSGTIFDSLGNPHIMTYYFVRTTETPTSAAGETVWEVYSAIDDEPAQPLGGADPGDNWIEFSAGGALVSPSPAAFTDIWAAPSGADEIEYVVNFQRSTQFGSEFSVNALHDNGYAPGRLAGIDISSTGVVFARYTNGQALTLGQVALANFANPQGLVPVGNSNWVESFDSGQPVIGAPETGSLGSIQSGALEDSNVDLSEQLVNLILAQRNFQANAKTIETEDTVTQAVINLR